MITGPFADASKPDGKVYYMTAQMPAGLAQVAIRQFYADGVTPYTINTSLSPNILNPPNGGEPLTFSPPTTAPVVIQFWKTVPGQNSRVGLLLTEGQGTTRVACDPMFDNVDAGTDRTYADVTDADRVLTLVNGAPGVDAVIVDVNPDTPLARQFTFDFTANAPQSQSRNISAYLYAGGSNVLRVRSEGADPEGSATLLLSEKPLGS